MTNRESEAMRQKLVSLARAEVTLFNRAKVRFEKSIDAHNHVLTKIHDEDMRAHQHELMAYGDVAVELLGLKRDAFYQDIGFIPYRRREAECNASS